MYSICLTVIIIIICTYCLIFCTSSGSFLVTAYLNSKDPLFSIVNEFDLRPAITMQPKLTSLVGVTEYLI